MLIVSIKQKIGVPIELNNCINNQIEKKCNRIYMILKKLFDQIRIGDILYSVMEKITYLHERLKQHIQVLLLLFLNSPGIKGVKRCDFWAFFLLIFPVRLHLVGEG